MQQFVGIDISKKTFDVYFEQEGKGSHVKLDQTKEGYKVLVHLDIRTTADLQGFDGMRLRFHCGRMLLRSYQN